MKTVKKALLSLLCLLMLLAFVSNGGIVPMGALAAGEAEIEAAVLAESDYSGAAGTEPTFSPDAEDSEPVTDAVLSEAQCGEENTIGNTAWQYWHDSIHSVLDSNGIWIFWNPDSCFGSHQEETPEAAPVPDVQNPVAGGEEETVPSADGDDTAPVQEPEGLTIDETAFPDEAFRKFVSNKFDKDGDGRLSDAEIADVTSIFCTFGGIQSLQGVEYFTALTDLYCSYNQLTELDVSRNTALTYLSCTNNRLTSLNVGGNSALGELYCYSNQLTVLDISDCTALRSLNCTNNCLAELDVGRNTTLTILSCYDNSLANLDVSGNTALKYLYCYNNLLETLNISGNTSLKYLDCSNNRLTELDVSQSTALNTLICYNNELASLDVSRNRSLIYLHCRDNRLVRINISGTNLLAALSAYFGRQKDNTNILVSMTASQLSTFTGKYALDSDNSGVNAVLALLGDVHYDGVVNLTDVSLLFRYLSGNAAASSVDMTAGDMNGDGAVNLRDVAAIYRQCNENK